MQSKQSKILMAGLVAAHSVAALEIKETGLVQAQGEQANHTMLAQIKDDENDVTAPSNMNDNPTPAASTSQKPSDDDINAKIDLLTTANLAGLTAKEEFILKKLKYYKKEQIELFCSIDDACRAKMEARLEEYKGIIDTARDAAFAGAKECRVNYVDQLLYQKEIIKGKLEDLLNETIQQIKELKVEGILNESGMPTDEHKSQLDTQIEMLISTFETNSDELLMNAGMTGFT